MSIKKEGKLWRARVDMGFNQVTGKRIQKSARFNTKHEAEEWEHSMRAKRGMYCDFTVAEFWDGFYIPYQRERVREVTLAHYMADFDKYARPMLGSIKLSDIKTLHVQSAMDSLKHYGAKQNLYRVMRQMLRKARAWNMVDTVATDGCDLPKHRRKPIEVAEASRLPEYLDAVEKYAPDILAGVCFSMMGLRRSEVCALRWNDVSLDTNPPTVHVHASVTYVNKKRCENATKTEHSERILVIPEWIMSYLLRCRSVGLVVLLQPDGYSNAWIRAIEKAGLPRVTLKNLRHTIGTALVDNGASLTDTQNWLGHDLPTTTAKYYVQQTQASIVRASNTLDTIVHIFSQNGSNVTKNASA